MDVMDFEVLPGPSLPELARTALARAAAANVSDANPTGAPPPAAPVPVLLPAGPVPVRSARDGSPLLLPATGSPVARWLGSGPSAVRVSVPAGAPFSALRLTGTARPVTGDHATGITACVVAIDSVEFTGADCARIPVDEYRAVEPDPLWRVAPSVLRHLEQGHMAELVRCVRAHGMTKADWVIPRNLDRYGLELLVLTTDGAASVRLSFPVGPITSIDDIPTSIRTALTCRCQTDPY
jgi:hypothetical protein